MRFGKGDAGWFNVDFQLPALDPESSLLLDRGCAPVEGRGQLCALKFLQPSFI